MTAVWLEGPAPEPEWDCFGNLKGGAIVVGGESHCLTCGSTGLHGCGGPSRDWQEKLVGEVRRQRATLGALVRALLAAEVCLHGCSEGCGYQPACGTCDGNVDFIAEGPVVVGHKVDHGKIAGGLACPLDAALTLAGLPDQASRDEARAAIAARVAR